MPKSLSEEHPELFHYTSAAGLTGILQSKTLRATHYAYLNDAEEIKHFLECRVEGILQGVESQITNRHAKNISTSILRTLLIGSVNKEPLAEPYILSFCTTKNRDSKIDRHGLLSQWRGYGREGGYAVVFDTADLSKLLQDFNKKWENTEIFAGDVIYSSATNQMFVEEFNDDLQIIKRWASDLQLSENSEQDEYIFGALMKCACRYKHWGFSEENEVRVIAIPNSNEVRELAKREGLIINEIPRKQFLRSGIPVPYIDLLEGITSSEKHLPIKRIIIGPSANEQERNKRVRAVEILLAEHGIRAGVTASEIPFIG